MIRVTDLHYSAGAFTLQMSLQIEAGQYFVLMGPTGSGKTAAVECIAGLRQPDAGRVEISGQDVTWREPRHRGIGYVPQDYALFALRTVRRNIGFGAEVQRRPKAEVERTVNETARLLGIEALLDRRINGLSGGERQRVALARALAVEPRILILDEPVSALDEATRERVCAEIRRVQRTLNLTTIHVSHNLEEAFLVADRAAVMRAGRIEQVGTMEDLLRRPRSEFVARFMRCENIFRGVAERSGARPGTTRVRVGELAFDVPGQRAGSVCFIVRPENLALRKAQADHGPGIPAEAGTPTPSSSVAGHALPALLRPPATLRVAMQAGKAMQAGGAGFVGVPPSVARRSIGAEAAGAPHHVTDSLPDATVVPARVARVTDRGAYTRIDLDAFQPLVAYVPHEALRRLDIASAPALSVAIPWDAMHVLEKTDEAERLRQGG